MKKQQPLVSIIVTSFNHGQYIEKAIESALAQTYNVIEILIIDDGSTDNTHTLLKSKYSDNRNIQLLLNDVNKGYAYRANEAINASRGDYICFLSSDDWFISTKVEKQIKKFDELDSSYGVVYSGGARFFEDTQDQIDVNTNKIMKKGWILKELLTLPFFVYPITPMVRRECFLKYPYTNKYKAEGEAIYFKIAMTYKFDFINEVLVVMRDHSYNTGKNVQQMLSDNIAYREDLFDHPDFPDELKYLKSRVIAQIYYLQGWELIRLKKKYKEGYKALKTACTFDRRYFLNPRVILGLLISVINK